MISETGNFKWEFIRASHDAAWCFANALDSTVLTDPEELIYTVYTVLILYKSMGLLIVNKF